MNRSHSHNSSAEIFYDGASSKINDNERARVNSMRVGLLRRQKKQMHNSITRVMLSWTPTRNNCPLVVSEWSVSYLGVRRQQVQWLQQRAGHWTLSVSRQLVAMDWWSRVSCRCWSEHSTPPALKSPLVAGYIRCTYSLRSNPAQYMSFTFNLHIFDRHIHVSIHVTMWNSTLRVISPFLFF